MKGLSIEKIKYFDGLAKKLGLEERLLIENASSNLFSAVHSLDLGRNVLIVSGRGNNGADVLSCARKLFCRDYKVQVAIISEKPLGKEADFQRDILEKLGLPLYFIKQDNIADLKNIIKDKDFIIEGILGIGIKGEVDEFRKNIIKTLNESQKVIVACDIPSGLCPDQGKVLGSAIKADYTVSFIAAKKGFFINQGPEVCGKVLVVDIGVSREMLERVERKGFLNPK